MSVTESKGDFIMFRDTLTELEFLVDIRSKLSFSWARAKATKAVTEGVVHTMKLLTEYDVQTSVTNAIEELERLLKMKSKLQIQNNGKQPIEFDNGRIFDKMIDSKIDFIKKCSFGGLVRKGGVKPMDALKRLTECLTELDSYCLDDLIDSKTRDFVWRPRLKASFTHDLVPLAEYTIPSFFKASQEQMNPKPVLPNECDDSKVTAKFVSNPLSWLQDQDSVHAEDEDGSTIDGGELTPASTIVSEMPDAIDG